MRTRTVLGLLAMAVAIQGGAGELLKPPAIWKDYDPNKGDFKEEIVKQDTQNGIYYRDSYISAYVLNEEIRVYCKYSVKAGISNAPGLLEVHGAGGFPQISSGYVNDGWAVMAHDYCGKVSGRKDYTKYPESLPFGNMDSQAGPVIDSRNPDGSSITDPKRTSLYVWYAMDRRVLSYLEQQKEVDKSRLGAKGYSVGGTLMWALGTDPRIKAIIPYFGIGWIAYYRDQSVWMYNNPYVEPAKTPGEKIFLAGIAPQAYVPYITAATLYLNGSDDHHGGFERGLESFKMFKKGVLWAFAVQARGEHDTDKTGQDANIWLDKYVVGKTNIVWPEHPESVIRLDKDGVPELIVTPNSPETVKNVEMYYALKTPASFTRAWRDAACIKKGATWVGKMPVMNVNDYVFGYANINYDTTIVLSTAFNAAIPSKLGSAKATDKRSDVIYPSSEGISMWNNVVEDVGPRGIKGIRAKEHSGTMQLGDPKWQAPTNAQLSVKFYCTTPQAFILHVNNYFDLEVALPASDDWQETVIHANKLLFRFGEQHGPLRDWSDATILGFESKQGSDVNKIIFGEFKWVNAQ